jgi:hypothetical protein
MKLLKFKQIFNYVAFNSINVNKEICFIILMFEAKLFISSTIKNVFFTLHLSRHTQFPEYIKLLVLVMRFKFSSKSIILITVYCIYYYFYLNEIISKHLFFIFIFG